MSDRVKNFITMIMIYAVVSTISTAILWVLFPTTPWIVWYAWVFFGSLLIRFARHGFKGFTT